MYASKPGYLNESKARRHYFGAVHEVSVSKAAPPPPVVIKLAKASVVAGTVRDVDGQPVPNAQVRLLRSWPVGGTESFEAMVSSTSLSTRTNDRGEYRVTGVEPGNYIAGVFEGLLRDLASREQYGLPNLYPGTTELADALPFTVGIDEEKSGIDFKLLRAASLSITGRITGVDGPFRRGLPIRLVRSSLSSINGEFEVGRTYVGATGEFTLSNIAPGTYTLSMADFPMHSETAMYVVAIVGCATAFYAATIGLVQSDIKKVLAYSTVSQLGYMFLGCGVGAFSAGIFHLMTHAFFKALLFLSAGSVIHAMGGEQDMWHMGGLASKIKVTFWCMLFGTIAIAGFFPFAAFFSKDAILFAAFNSEHGGKALYAVGLLAADSYLVLYVPPGLAHVFRQKPLRRTSCPCP